MPRKRDWKFKSAIDVAIFVVRFCQYRSGFDYIIRTLDPEITPEIKMVVTALDFYYVRRITQHTFLISQIFNCRFHK